MGQVLIVTQELDPHADAVVSELKKMGARVARFHPADFPGRSFVTMSTIKGAGSFKVDQLFGLIRSRDVGSVWYRRPEKPVIPSGMSETEARVAAQECSATLIDLWSCLEDCLCVNHPNANRYAECKMTQLRQAQKAGLRVPDTLITNDPRDLSQFYEAHGGKVVVKTQRTSFWASQSGQGLYTSRVTPEHLEQADLLSYCPCVFQEEIPKSVELRITVIGSRVFSAALRSQEVPAGAVDWRRATAEIPHERWSLDMDVEKKVLALVRAFGLQYGALDLIITPAGEHVFLELNPNGQFGWIEERTGLKLYRAMAELLTGRVI